MTMETSDIIGRCWTFVVAIRSLLARAVDFAVSEKATAA